MLEKNLQAIAKNNPILAQRILAHNHQGVEFTTCENGEYNLIYKGSLLHDSVDPQLEARIIFGEDEDRENSLKALFGLGLGYLFKRAYISSTGYILIYEPVLDILKATLEVVDFSNELSDPRVFIINDISELIISFSKYLVESVSILALSSYIELFADQLELLKFQLNRYFLDQVTNINKSQKIAASFVSNLPLIIKEPSVEVLENKFINRAVLIVSAGPSLEKTVKQIKENRDKFIIISVGQAVRALIAEDIVPDLVMIIDMLPFLHQIACFEDKKDFLNLVLQPSCSKEIFQVEANTRFVYMPNSNFMSEWMKERLNFKTYKQAGTVSICAFNLAILSGANPIILVGQDLAYSGNKVYASNTIYDTVRVNLNADNAFEAVLEDSELFDGIESRDNLLSKNLKGYEKTLLVKGQNGEDLYTSNSYALFISLFKDLVAEIKCKNPDISLFNCSEGGAFIEGFEHKKLSEVISYLRPIDIDVKKLLSDEYHNIKTNDDNARRINLEFVRFLKDLRSLKEDSEKVRKFTNNLKKELKSSKILTNKLLGVVPKLQKLDQKLKEYNKGHRISFIYPFIQKELFEYNKIKDNVPSDKLKILQSFVNTLDKYAEVMIIGVDRTLSAFDNVEEFPSKE